MKLIILLMFFISGFTPHSNNEAPNIKSSEQWKLVKSKKGIEIYQQWITLDNGHKTRRLKACFQADTPSDYLVDFLSKDGNNINWLSGACESKNLNSLSNEWVSYTHFNLPWPFNDQDLIANYNVVSKDNYTIVRMCGNPNQLPYYQNVVRIKQFEGYWRFTPNSASTTKVEYSVYSVTKPVAPRFIQDPIVIQSFYNSLKNFKIQTSKNENQQA